MFAFMADAEFNKEFAEAEPHKQLKMLMTHVTSHIGHIKGHGDDILCITWSKIKTSLDEAKSIITKDN